MSYQHHHHPSNSINAAAASNAGPAPAAGANGIVNKLHDAINAFRRDKDVAHRNRDMAAERLKVTIEEREAEDAKTAALQAKLDEINRKIAAGNRDEMTKRQTDVERLRQETNFQHNELLRKREKLSTLEARMAEETNKRDANIRSVCRAVKIWREKNSISNVNIVNNIRNENDPAGGATATTAAAAPEQLKLILSDVEDRSSEEYIALLMKLPELIKSKAQTVMADADDMHREFEALGAIAHRYRTELGLTGGVGLDGSAGADGGGISNDAGNGNVDDQLMEEPMQQPVEAAFM